MKLDDLKAAVKKLKAFAIKPHPATAEECREHNRIMAERGRPDLSIKQRTMVFAAEEIMRK